MPRRTPEEERKHQRQLEQERQLVHEAEHAMKVRAIRKAETLDALKDAILEYLGEI